MKRQHGISQREKAESKDKQELREKEKSEPDRKTEREGKVRGKLRHGKKVAMGRLVGGSTKRKRREMQFSREGITRRKC